MKKANLSVALKATAEKPAASRQEKPARIGKKQLAGFFDPAVNRQLKQIALDEESTVQALLAEGINEVFAKRGKPPIA